MRDSIGKGKKIGQNTNPNSLEGPLTNSEIQKVSNFYLKIGKAPEPDNVQAELVKTMTRSNYTWSDYGSMRF